MAEKERVVCVSTFRTAGTKDAPLGVFVPEGAVFDADDPAVKGREALFRPAGQWGGDVVEMATAVPGVKRAARKKKDADG